MDAGTAGAQQAVMVHPAHSFLGNYRNCRVDFMMVLCGVGRLAYNGLIPIPFIYVGDKRVNSLFEDSFDVHETENEKLKKKKDLQRT